jgi:transcriptional regulator with XRE-family HTH domain
MDAARAQRMFGKAVRARRNALGITQEELAHRAGIHPTYLGDVERGERNIALVNILKLARALGVKSGSLMPDQG